MGLERIIVAGNRRASKKGENLMKTIFLPDFPLNYFLKVQIDIYTKKHQTLNIQIIKMFVDHFSKVNMSFGKSLVK